MNQDKQKEINRQIGMLEELLNSQFLSACGLGALYKDASPAGIAHLTLSHTKGDLSCNAQRFKDAVICHDVLCEFIKGGLSLSAATATARRTSPSKEAFERYVHGLTDGLEGNDD